VGPEWVALWRIPNRIDPKPKAQDEKNEAEYDHLALTPNIVTPLNEASGAIIVTSSNVGRSALQEAQCGWFRCCVGSRSTLLIQELLCRRLDDSTRKLSIGVGRELLHAGFDTFDGAVELLLGKRRLVMLAHGFSFPHLSAPQRQSSSFAPQTSQ
jgi:hypothetical protein